MGLPNDDRTTGDFVAKTERHGGCAEHVRERPRGNAHRDALVRGRRIADVDTHVEPSRDVREHVRERHVGEHAAIVGPREMRRGVHTIADRRVPGRIEPA